MTQVSTLMADQDTVAVPTGLQVLGAGMTVDQALHPDRILPHWVVGLVQDGELVLSIDDRTYVVPAGSYYLLPPEVRHRGTQAGRFTVLWWHVTGSSRNHVTLPVVGRAPEDLQAQTVLRTVQRMRLQMDDPRWVGVQVEALLARLASFQRGGPRSDHPHVADDLLDWLMQHRSHPWDRVALERRFKRTYRTLNRNFHDRYGTGLHARHLELRMELAKDLLLGGATLAEAGKGCGFGDYYAFLRRFRAQVGVSAGQWRRRGAASIAAAP